MLKLEAKSKKSSEKINEQLKDFFGEGGLGLDVNEESPGCLSFEGGGGYVTATICSEESHNRVELVTQEWEYQVKKFASELK